MTRNDIIKAAFKVWGRELYQTTSLSHVTQELGVSKPALYRHFKNKQALLDAMHTAFYDDIAAWLKPGYEEILKAGNKTEPYFCLNQIAAEYYIRNRDIFIFSLMQVFKNKALKDSLEEFRIRGIDLREAVVPCKKNTQSPYPSIFQLMSVTAFFWIALFHRFDYKPGEQPGEEKIQSALNAVRERITGGLALVREKVDALDYAALERRASQRAYEDTEDNKILRAVAGAVAEAGPWNASMEMVAHRSGLSKSSLYAHFKNKKEMIARLFITEFERIVRHARMGLEGSETPEEQLYLVIISIVEYLRSKPEILVAMDWIKTRRLELGLQAHPLKHRPRFYRVITDINLEALHGPQGSKIGDWILFMIVNTLMSYRNKNFKSVTNESFRILYRFITLGLKGVNV